MAKFIVAIETVKIKEFLFSTNKLKVIRGASYLLDYLNRVEVPKILKRKDRVKEELIKKNKGLSDKLTEVIFVTREGKVAGNFYYVNKKMDDIILKFTTDIEVKKKLAKDIEKNGEVI